MIHMIAIMADATVDKPMMRESVEEHRRWYLTPPPSLHEAYNGHQAMLPRLPIPPLRLTLRRYLDAALPFLGVAERDATVAAAAAFETSDGPRLRAELVALDALLPPSSSYIQESWCRVAYLQPREPSVVHSNPAALFAPPSWLSSLVASSHDTQLWRAATLLAGTARWTAALRGGTLPPPLGPGGVPLDMSQLPSLLGHARLPRKGCDVATSSFGRGAEHIVLGMAGRWYRVPIFTAAADGPGAYRMVVTPASPSFRRSRRCGQTRQRSRRRPRRRWACSPRCRGTSGQQRASCCARRPRASPRWVQWMRR